MADKRDAGEPKEGNEAYKPPNFDEDAFIHREVTAFRSSLILFCWGIVAAAVSWLVFNLLDGAKAAWSYGLAVCIIMGFGLKWLLPKLGADIRHYKRGNWMGTGFLFFLTWISFFMLAVNPPVSDYAAPQVHVIVSPSVPEPGQTMTIHVLAADNVGIRGDPEIVVKRAGQAVPATLVHDEGDLYHAELVAQAGTYNITVRASDARHTGIGYGEVTVRHVLTTYPATLTTPSDAVAVTASDVGYCPAQHAQQQKACIVAMYLMGDGINVTMGFDETLEHWTWKATRNNAGFHEGVNNVTAHAVYVDHFLGSRRIAGGEAVSSPFQVTINGTVGSIVFTDKNGGPRTQPSAAERTTPGFEMVAAVVALVAVGAVIRRRRAA